ncbi:MAG: protein phosphatase 2C domain-containing protein [Thermodesulfobacteriota bacterium]
MKFAVRTHTGLVRERNEDAVLALPALGLFMVADGMGGHDFGAEASGIAVERVRREVERASKTLDLDGMAQVLEQALHASHDDIVSFSRQRAAGQTMGTTATVVWLRYGRAAVGHVGDSRLYRLRQGSLEQLTRDHTLIQDAMDMGRISAEQAEDSPYRNVLSRALGSEGRSQPDIFTLDLMPDDLLLLCTDGLDKVLSDAEITAVLACPGTDLQNRAAMLEEMALARGGPDNISLILVEEAPEDSFHQAEAPVQAN